MKVSTLLRLAFADARQQMRETAPRRALVREAFAATRRLPGIRQAGAAEVSAALRQALAARGVTDLSDRSLEPLVRAVQTSRLSVTADYAISGVVKAREIRAWLTAHKYPAWLMPPETAVQVVPDRWQRVTARVDLEPRDLILLGRLVADAPLPVRLPDEDEVEVEVAPSFRCWVDLDDAADERSAALVHVGTQVLGRLEDGTAELVRPTLFRLARGGQSLLAHAELHGPTPQTLVVEVTLLVDPLEE